MALIATGCLCIIVTAICAATPAGSKEPARGLALLSTAAAVMPIGVWVSRHLGDIDSPRAELMICAWMLGFVVIVGPLTWLAASLVQMKDSE